MTRDPRQEQGRNPLMGDEQSLKKKKKGYGRIKPAKDNKYLLKNRRKMANKWG